MIEFVDFTSLARRALLLAVVLAAGSCTLWAQYGGRGGGMRQHGGNMECSSSPRRCRLPTSSKRR